MNCLKEGGTAMPAIALPDHDRSHNKVNNLKPETTKQTVLGLRVAPMDEVRVGFIGLGERGQKAVKRISTRLNSSHAT